MKFFGDLYKIANNKEIISEKCEDGKWLAMDYENKLGKGKLLATSELIYPEPITLSLNLKGWHKIYIGLFNMRSENHIYAKLSGDEEYSIIRHTGLGCPKRWCATEYMEEVYWKCADLTDMQFVLAKPQLYFKSIAGLAWIRCEEMTEEEVERYKASLEMPNKCVQMHYDCDALFEDESEDRTKFFVELNRLKNTNADFVSFEYSILYDSEKDDSYFPMFKTDQNIYSGKYKNTDELLKKALEWSKQNGIKLYATERMSMSNFYAPYFAPNFKKRFFTDNTGYYCKTRDGKTVNACSYAYEEVWDYVIANMVRMAEMGFDGISMIFHRGIHIGYEQPVIDRFHELYPDVDPRRLPITDKRLNGVWCEFITNFMRRLRERMNATFDRHIELNAITAYSIEMARRVGLDLETWAKEGLVDSISQGDMEVFEELDGCLGDDGLIDLDKYSKVLVDRPIVRRSSGHIEKTCLYIKEFAELEEKYGVKVFNILPWVEMYDIETYKSWVAKMEELGAKRFLAYNTNHILCTLPEFHVVSHLGNDMGADVTLQKYYRTLSFDNSDISQYNPNWRG